MKKLIFALVAVVFSAGAFAQADQKADAKTDMAKPAQTEKKLNTHCYAMQNGTMMHCMKVKSEPMTKDVTLRNGTMISTKGEVTMKDGKKTMLKDGQCIDLTGTIGDFASMHPDMKMDEKKMDEKK